MRLGVVICIRRVCNRFALSPRMAVQVIVRSTPTLVVRGFAMRFRVSSLLFVTALISIGVAWYVESRPRRQRELIGAWNAVPHRIYHRSELVIRPDGTFTKFQYDDGDEVTFEGNFKVTTTGELEFLVTSELVDSFWDRSIRELEKNIAEARGEPIPPEPVPSPTSTPFRCFCAVDANGFLVINCLNSDEFPDTDFRWGVYSRR